MLVLNWTKYICREQRTKDYLCATKYYTVLLKYTIHWYSPVVLYSILLLRRRVLCDGDDLSVLSLSAALCVSVCRWLNLNDVMGAI